MIETLLSRRLSRADPKWKRATVICYRHLTIERKPALQYGFSCPGCILLKAKHLPTD